MEPEGKWKYNKREGRHEYRERKTWVVRALSVAGWMVAGLMIALLVGSLIAGCGKWGERMSTQNTSVSWWGAVSSAVRIDTEIPLSAMDMAALEADTMGVARIGRINKYRMNVYKATAFTWDDTIRRVTAYIEGIVKMREIEDAAPNKPFTWWSRHDD